MNKILIAVLPLCLLLASCKKWLDVSPKTQIESSVNFAGEQGFKDALTGVYLTLNGADLYGKDMTYGFVDALGQQHTQITQVAPDYYYAGQYMYTEESVVNKISSVWSRMYFAVANLNNLLKALESKDSTSFSDYTYNVVKGEALGLRAFLHFDLLRLFAPSPASKGMQAKAIPYRLNYSAIPEPRRNVGEVLNLALKDINDALPLLKTADPLVAGTTVPTTTTGYLRNRTLRFNYYAVLALKARVHLYAGNLDSARIAAQEVISSAKFPATALSAISGGNRTFSTEVIFNLNVNDIAILYAGFFNTSVRATKSVDQWNSWFEIAAGGSGDYRYLYQTALNGVYRLPVKLDGALNTNAAAAKKVPLMRLTEMYLIAAEAQLGTDNAAALTLVNTARRSRNLTDLPGTLTTPQIQQEIIKEYQKELLCEGQIFYLYKRLNLSELPYDFRSMNDEQYVLPLPDDELTYGRTK